jgi:hypothetical protein
VSRRLLDILAPVRPAHSDSGYRRVLRWAALPVTNRRWAAPLCALALGFGLFAGVAIGPGTTGSLATGAAPVIEIPSPLAAGEGDAEEESAGDAEAGGFTEAGSGGEPSFPTESSSSGSISSFPEVETPESSQASESAPAAKDHSPAGGEEEPAAEEEEEAQVLAGVVVHANPAAGSYTVAEAGGLLSSVHAAKLPAPGARVSVPVRILANGTFAEAGPRKQKGKTTQASFAGVVTFVDADPTTPAYTVSKRGVSVLVRIHPDPAGAPAVLPQLGAYASVVVAIEKAAPVSAAPPPPVSEAPPVAPAPVSTCLPDPALPSPPAPVAVLWQSQLDADGAPFASSDFEGVVMAVCAAEGTLLLSADDLRESGEDILFSVPKSLDTGKLKTGDSVTATAAIDAGGALSLTGLASDERAKGADDAATAQGDLVSHQPQ